MRASQDFSNFSGSIFTLKSAFAPKYILMFPSFWKYFFRICSLRFLSIWMPRHTRCHQHLTCSPGSPASQTTSTATNDAHFHEVKLELTCSRLDSSIDSESDRREESTRGDRGNKLHAGRPLRTHFFVQVFKSGILVACARLH